MKGSTATLVMLSGLTVVGIVSTAQAQQSASFTGTVQRVWEDGFRLNTGDRSLRVDTWDLYGDATASYIRVGDQITMTGEFDGREFDAFSITNGSSTAEANPNSLPDSGIAQVPAGQSFTGTVEQVWEDGFRLNAGDRTLRVDSWDLCGDGTANHVSVSDRLQVTGEFDSGEFDAFSIHRMDGTSICR